MIKSRLKIRRWIYSIFTIVALIIVADFIIPGTVFLNEIVNIKRQTQQYNNAAGNYHYSYKVFTRKHNFFISKDFAETIKENQKIKYSVSRIFNEVNSYSSFNPERKGMYPLRIVSGLIIPLIVILMMGITSRYEKKIVVLAFVLKAALIADLIFLIF